MSALPLYQVEFIPVERRLNDRRANLQQNDSGDSSRPTLRSLFNRRTEDRGLDIDLKRTESNKFFCPT